MHNVLTKFFITTEVLATSVVMLGIKADDIIMAGVQGKSIPIIREISDITSPVKYEKKSESEGVAFKQSKMVQMKLQKTDAVMDTAVQSQKDIQTVTVAERIPLSQEAAPQEAESQVTASSYTYSELSEQKYVSTSLNVRELPSTDGAVVGVLNTNDKIAITGKCNETGWYRINYNNTSGYISEKYVTDAPVVIEPKKDKHEISARTSENRKASAQSDGGTISNANYSDVIYADGTISVDLCAKAQGQLNYIPANLMAEFKSEGWKLKLTDQNIGSLMFGGASNIIGATSEPMGAIYVADTKHAVSCAVVHEFGHYLDHLTYTSFDSSEFSNIYAAEASSLKSSFGLSSSDTCNVHEYYASCFYSYIMNPGMMQSVAPQSYQFIQNDLGRI